MGMGVENDFGNGRVGLVGPGDTFGDGPMPLVVSRWMSRSYLGSQEGGSPPTQGRTAIPRAMKINQNLNGPRPLIIPLPCKTCS